MAPAVGTVKHVLSGDTLIVMGRAVGGPPPERMLTLDGIIAPRLMRRDGQGSADEPFAFESKEALRKAAIGKEVSFTVIDSGSSSSSGGANERVFAVVKLTNNGVPAEGTTTNLAVLQAENGMAKVKNNKASGDSEIAQLLVAAEDAAKSAGLGVWNSDPAAIAASVRDPSVASVQAKDVAEAIGADKNTPARAVVEYVINGHMLRVTFLPSMVSAAVSLSGVQCPPTGSGSGPDARPPAAYSREAKFFTECRVLGRDVLVTLEGTDAKHGNLFGTVRYGAGNLGEDLLKSGLAKVATWSIGSTLTAATLRAAERSARDARLRVWKGWEPAAPTVGTPSGSAREFFARVIEVSSPDTLVVAPIVAGASGPVAQQQLGPERQIRLANLRVPRMGRRDERPAPFAWEAREFVRTRVIGRKVRVFIDFVKPAADNFPERHCATVYTEKGNNIAESLVKAGFATVAKLRPEHEERSSRYDDLLAAEDNAVAEKRGQHNPKPPAVPHLSDVSNAVKAKSFLPALQRQRRIKGIVEYVFNGARVKVTIPKESCQAAVSIAGVRAAHVPGPNSDNNANNSSNSNNTNKAAQDALKFTRQSLLHRDVEVEVFDSDKGGALIAAVYIGGVNMSIVLAEQGLAKTSFADRLPFADELYAAEERAKDARIGLWEGYVEPTAAPESEIDSGAAAAAAGPKERIVRAVEVISAVEIVAHVGATRADVEAIAGKIRAASASTGGKFVGPAKRGAFALARFSGDGELYRSKILEVSPDGTQARVLFVDYGNSDVVELKDMEPLPAGSFGTLPAQAITLKLAHLKEAPEIEDGMSEEAAYMTRKLVFEKDLKGKICAAAAQDSAEPDQPARPVVTLVDEETGLCVNNAIVRAGLALVVDPRKKAKGAKRWGPKKEVSPEDAKMVDSLLEDQEKARSGRLNAWKFGDIDEDEDL